MDLYLLSLVSHFNFYWSISISFIEFYYHSINLIIWINLIILIE